MMIFRKFRLITMATVIFWGCYVFASISVAQDQLPDPVDDSDYMYNGKPQIAEIKLGKLLFYDKILSGNKNISCATCHHGLTDTGDGISLPVGEGGRGLGVMRNTGGGEGMIKERVPRNAPPVFSLGANVLNVLFHDGRVSVNDTHPSGFNTPAGDETPLGLDNVLAAQALFPVTSATEMAGQMGENSIADSASLLEIWSKLADRLRVIPKYVDLFYEAFGIAAEEISYVHAANAIAAFEGHAWRADKSPFDLYLRGDKQAMSINAVKGMRLFYGAAKCSTCHSGSFQTDMKFHAIAVPQIGPGKGDGVGGHEDFGRENVSGDILDRYKFRTPHLRNVALTGPWGHDGAFSTLEAVVRHHLNPMKSIDAYDCKREPILPSRADLDALDCLAMSDSRVVDAIKAANELESIELKVAEFENLMTFLHALTDPSKIDLRGDVPMSVPSGLTITE